MTTFSIALSLKGLGTVGRVAALR